MMTDVALSPPRSIIRSSSVGAALAIVTIAALVRLALAALIPPFADETYYWEWSRRLAAGYFDHPAAIALLVRSGVALFGVTPLGIRFGSIVAGWGATICVVLLARRLGGDGAALRAAIIVSCMPLAAAGLVLATPDAPLLLAVTATLLALDLAVAEPPGSRESLGWWLVSGAILGLALDSKYSAILIPLGVFIALIIAPSLRRHLATPAPYLAVLLALAIFGPVIAWNAQHNWASFHFQLHHGFAPHGGSAIDREGTLLGAQLAIVSPILFVLLATATVHALRPRAPREFLLATVGATIFLFFCTSALTRPAEANWQAPAYIPAIALLALWSGRPAWRNWLRAGALLGGAMIVVLYIQSVVPILPVKPSADPTARGAGWNTLARRVGDISAALPTPAGARTWLAGNRYQDASEIAFHTPTHPITFSLNLASRPNQYDLWPAFPNEARTGDNLVLVLDADPASSADSTVTLLRAHFARVREAGTVDLKRGPDVRTQRRVWVLEDWRGSWPVAPLR